MGKKESFVFYTSVWPQLFKMLENDEERGQLIMAIIDYVSLETLPSGNHSRAFFGAFEIMKEQLDKDAAKWQQTVQARTENGKKGGLAKASNAKQNLANASKCYQTLANVADNVNVNDISGYSMKVSPQKTKYEELEKNEYDNLKENVLYTTKIYLTDLGECELTFIVQTNRYGFIII